MGWQRDQTTRNGLGDRLSTIAGVEFGEQRADVKLGGTKGDGEFVRNLLICHALRQ